MAAGDAIEIPLPSPDDVLFRRDGEIAWITLNRPVVLNAINWSMPKPVIAAVRESRDALYTE